jgi:hypothetical protein
MLCTEHPHESPNTTAFIIASSDRTGIANLKGPICTNRPLRQDALDEVVWKEIIRLLDNARLIQGEIDGRQQAAQKADPLRKREQDCGVSKLEKSR